jgi:UDP-N-acetylglucosamine/UDP-N-acetylgalactosamine diphosphorylase
MEEKFKKAKEVLEKYDQMQLLRFYDELDIEQKEQLLDQILSIDFENVKKLYESTKQSIQIKKDKIEPIEYIDKQKLSMEELTYFRQIGEEIIKSGQYAIATMAGGQGTRLGHPGPKGTYPLIDKKSLYEIFYDTLNRANQRYGVIIPWYIMTSKENHNDTVCFFEQNSYFGYPKQDIMFFEQSELPMMDQSGKILLSEKGIVKQASDGNGGIFSSMARSGVLEDLKKRNVKWLFIGPIDNAILNMVDPILVGVTEEAKLLGASKTVTKSSPNEKVGVFCRRNTRPSVIEYTELPEEMANLRDENGELYYGEAHIMCNLFNVSILEKIASEKLPYHIAFKKASYINEKGNLIEPQENNAYKFESFIFDAFETLDNIKILRGLRQEEFAPVKNAQGVDSPETARQLYFEYHKNRKN